MPSTRDAVATLKGYYYQFDYFILQLLEAATDDTVVTLEGMEDVDIKTAIDTTAVQCKYYAGTDYTHSKIAQPIRLMLRDYVNHLDSALKYKLYGYYRSGTDKLTLPLTVDFVKEHFLTYTEKGVAHVFHTENGITDDQIGNFISDLQIDLNAREYEEQEKAVLQTISKEFRVRVEHQVETYYNLALAKVRTLCTSPDVADRQISKGSFVEELKSCANATFDVWYLEKKGPKKYCQLMRAKYFSSYNLSPSKRFFLVDVKGATLPQIIKVLRQLKEKYAKFGGRESRPFCPFVYLHNLSESNTLSMMRQLVNDQFAIQDGYAFKGADFDAQMLAANVQKDHRVDLKVLYTVDELNQTLTQIRTSKQVYQFYLDSPFFNSVDGVDDKICISELSDINSII